MKTKIIICTLILILSTFVGSVWAGTENATYTYYGLGAGGSSSTAYNTFIGAVAGNLNTTGYYNTFTGNGAGYNNTEGYSNTYIGHGAGSASILGKGNTFIGAGAGVSTNGDGAEGGITSGSGNVFVGAAGGYSNTTGAGNTFLGFKAGYLNTTGAGNLFIGHEAGYYETSNSKLYIANDGTATPLIYGDFYNKIVTVNGNLGIGTKVPVRQLHIVGDQAVFRMDRPSNSAAFMLVRTDVSGNPLKTFVVGANASESNTGEFVINDLGTAVLGGGSRRMTIANDGSVNFPGAVTALSFTPVSSIVHKANVKTYENALETVKKLRGVRFNWKDSGKASVGLIAEEVDKVIPEVVAHNDKDATGVNYDSLVGVLVEAVKEQQGLIKEQHAELKEQKGLIQAHQKAIQDLQEQQKINASLSNKVSELERLLIMSNSVSKAD